MKDRWKSGRCKVADDLDAVFRREHGRCVATLIRVLGDIDLAEDAVAEAFTIATDRWRRDGVPHNPGAWITTTARNRAIDRLRRESSRNDRYVAAHRLEHTDMTDDEAGELGLLDDIATVVPDDQLRLIFLCCHPALHADARVALSLRLLGGLEIAEIAAGFVVAEATMAKRIVRAKQKLRHNNVPYRIPVPTELPDRLCVVLTVISLIYTEGHRATSGNELIRRELTEEALRLARLVHELMPDEPEATGLLALVLLTESRTGARLDGDGDMVRLADQDRTRWDRGLIDEGQRLVRACLRRNQPGPFQIQAAIAAVHADARTDDETDRQQVLALYDQLDAIRPSPVVAINRAVALAEVRGAAAGLDAIDAIERTPQIEAFQPYHAVRADLLARSGRTTEAIECYGHAIALTATDSERRFLEQRLEALRPAGAPADDTSVDGARG